MLVYASVTRVEPHRQVNCMCACHRYHPWQTPTVQFIKKLEKRKRLDLDEEAKPGRLSVAEAKTRVLTMKISYVLLGSHGTCH